jgi:hypothetical protein
MALDWKFSIDDLNWEELSALYRAAPLGEMKLRRVHKGSCQSGCRGLTPKWSTRMTMLHGKQ